MRFFILYLFLLSLPLCGMNMVFDSKGKVIMSHHDAFWEKIIPEGQRIFINPDKFWDEAMSEYFDLSIVQILKSNKHDLTIVFMHVPIQKYMFMQINVYKGSRIESSKQFIARIGVADDDCLEAGLSIPENYFASEHHYSQHYNEANGSIYIVQPPLGKYHQGAHTFILSFMNEEQKRKITSSLPYFRIGDSISFEDGGWMQETSYALSPKETRVSCKLNDIDNPNVVFINQEHISFMEIKKKFTSDSPKYLCENDRHFINYRDKFFFELYETADGLRIIGLAEKSTCLLDIVPGKIIVKLDGNDFSSQSKLTSKDKVTLETIARYKKKYIHFKLLPFNTKKLLGMIDETENQSSMKIEDKHKTSEQ